MVKKIISVFLITLLTAVCFLSALPVSATETYYSEAINMLAKEDFNGNDYLAAGSSIRTNVANTYQEGKTTTGIGWDGLWSTTPDTYTAPTDDDKIQLNYLEKMKTNGGTNGTYRMLKIPNNSANKVAYRLLAEPIDFDDDGAVYEFSFDVLETISSANSNRTPLRFKVGDKFEVGYDRDSTYTKIQPVIIVGETTVTSTTELEVGGGETNGEFVTFTVRVEINAAGDDKITLTAKESELQLAAAWNAGLVTDDVATAEMNTELSGKVSYIGFGSTQDKAVRKEIRDIKIREIKSCEANADCVATVNTSIIDGSVAFGKTVSADIDVEAKSGNDANIISLVAVKNNNKLVGVKCAEATLSESATTGTMALSYAFSEDNGWNSDDFDATNVGVSFIVWNKDTLTPYINKVGFGTEEYD